MRKHKRWLLLLPILLALIGASSIYAATTTYLPEVELPQTQPTIVNEVSLEKLQDKYEKSTEIKAKYQLDGISLKRTVKADPKDMLRVEIGDNTKTEFEPTLKISRWDEVDLTLKPKALEGVVTEDKGLKLEGDKIKFETPKIDYHLYELTEGEGGYEFEVILKEKPTTNIVEFTLDAKGLDFFYQPELTQKEKDSGSIRPENVVGSYAVYTSEQKTNWEGGKLYKTGKVGHIYRPKIVDSAGNWVWGLLSIDKGTLSVEIPQAFLDNAVYPVRHAAGLTFGYTSEGASTVYPPGNMLFGYLHASPATSGMTGVSMSMYGYYSGGGANVKMMLYPYTDGVTYITNGITGGVALPEISGLVTATFGVAPNIAASTNYLLTVVFSSDANLKGDASGGTEEQDWSNSYATPTTFNWDGNSAFKGSIYCTYAAGGGPPAYQPRPPVGISPGGMIF